MPARMLRGMRLCERQCNVLNGGCNSWCRCWEEGPTRHARAVLVLSNVVLVS
jgi:hypothetical protein